MMLQGRGGEERLYTSIVDACRKIYRYEGVSGFFKGMIPTYLKVPRYRLNYSHAHPGLTGLTSLVCV